MKGDGSFQFTQEEYDRDMWKWVGKLLLVVLSSLAVIYVAFLSIASGQEGFPSCTELEPPGDWAHYDEGWHQIAGNGLLWGQDDVYSLEDGNFVQCFCSPDGEGIQTNWYPDEGGDEDGEEWNLEEGYYSYENIEYSCSEIPEPSPTPDPSPTPTPTPTPTVTPTPVETHQSFQNPVSLPSAPVCVGQPVTKAPLYWESLLERVDGDTVRIRWVPQDPHAQRYGVKYGMSKDNLSWYAEFPWTSDSGELNLVPTGHVWVEICSIGACGDRVCGPQVDP